MATFAWRGRRKAGNVSRYPVYRSIETATSRIRSTSATRPTTKLALIEYVGVSEEKCVLMSLRSGDVRVSPYR
jgi:hypothetical protein